MSIETAVRYRRLLLLLLVLVAGMWHLHLRDANKKRCSESSENVIFSSYYAPLLQHGPLPVWHFPSSWGESSQPDNEAQSSDKKVRNAGGPRRERCACFGRRRGGARGKKRGGGPFKWGPRKKKKHNLVYQSFIVICRVKIFVSLWNDILPLLWKNPLKMHK